MQDYKSPTCVLRKFAGDMSHRPSMLIKAHKHCYGLSFLRTSKLSKEKMHCRGLPKTLKRQPSCISQLLFKTPRKRQNLPNFTAPSHASILPAKK